MLFFIFCTLCNTECVLRLSKIMQSAYSSQKVLTFNTCAYLSQLCGLIIDCVWQERKSSFQTDSSIQTLGRDLLDPWTNKVETVILFHLLKFDCEASHECIARMTSSSRS